MINIIVVSLSMFITYIPILFLQEPQWKHTICVCLRLLALLSMIISSCIHFTAIHVKLYLRSKKIMEFESLCISMIYYNIECCEELLNSWGSLNYFSTSYFMNTAINPILQMRQLCHSQADSLGSPS